MKIYTVKLTWFMKHNDGQTNKWKDGSTNSGASVIGFRLPFTLSAP